ncbi:D-alanyl-D-alanine carboxypeptidase precursor [Streptomyces sp. YIM 121038]|uniref:serine hydrolase domain-containing protein n=1 Tax=Streptomyces sp. YIM 121038 TaxID=2136401 RepID=UPI001161FF73|nr:serine hydrolase domain-containing protein [Streptomyces sp. YIM 121038]QCX73999.1 D-alanyl-D-alanine carboxypeptidase precursor [Streptomyces sp. YIM 121038]
MSVLTVAGLGIGLEQPGQAATGPTGTVSAHDAPASGKDAGAHRRDQLDTLARKVVAAGAPGVVVRVDDGRGRPIEVVEQAPWARSEHRLRPGDEFRMGSNTKTMMATLVLQLAAEGKLALTDPVAKWLPGQVPDGHAITLRMLLNHTSGLHDYTEDPELVPSILGKDPRRWTSEQLLAVGVRHDPHFPPGTRWAYSNTNYAAVGAVLEKATGRSLAELVRDRIARPLGLRHTYYAEDSTWRGPHARGYEPDAAHMPPGVPPEFRNYAGVPRAEHVDVSANSPAWGGAAGAVVSTARDWDRFYTALMSGELLPAAQLAQMRTTVPIFPDQPDGPGYGLGIQTATTECGTVWSHDGGIPGYLSTHLTDPTGRRTASVLISTEAFAEFPEAFPQLIKSAKALQSATLCALFDKPGAGGGTADVS